MALGAPKIDGLSAGDVVAGKYRIESVLGEGGMGIVVAAHHVHLDERVALKFLRGQTARDADAVVRFAREARAAARIKNEHVARVTDVGQLDDGSPFMVMEYLEGCDLASWLRQRGPMPVAQAVDFVLQTCEALADAHSLGIVHRDLKPADLFCIQRSDGSLSIKVLDSGISKLTTLGGQQVLSRWLVDARSVPRVPPPKTSKTWLLGLKEATSKFGDFTREGKCIARELRFLRVGQLGTRDVDNGAQSEESGIESPNGGRLREPFQHALGLCERRRGEREGAGRPGLQGPLELRRRRVVREVVTIA
jgi:serine/threonine protein kinase